MKSKIIKNHRQFSNNLSGWDLGAPLYIPALHPDLLKIANSEKIPRIRSMIICTEDAVAEKYVETSMQNLARFLPFIDAMSSQYRFIRPRNPKLLKRILDLPGIEQIDGFVLPKFDRSNIDAYCKLLQNSGFLIMPTLETAEVFDAGAMRELAQALAAGPLHTRIPLLRIGGNDLLNLLSIRRPRGMTIYETPLASVISQLITVFRPLGFSLSAPVFEYLADHDTLEKEIRLDLCHGLIGKTAIHPTQIALIEQYYSVPEADYREAISIMSSSSPAVFKMHEAMCEVATHGNWAGQILKRHECYGLRGSHGGSHGVADIS